VEGIDWEESKWKIGSGHPKKKKRERVREEHATNRKM